MHKIMKQVMKIAVYILVWKLNYFDYDIYHSIYFAMNILPLLLWWNPIVEILSWDIKPLFVF